MLAALGACAGEPVVTSGTLSSGTTYTATRIENSAGPIEDIVSQSGPDVLMFSGRRRNVQVSVQTDATEYNFVDQDELSVIVEVCAAGDISPQPNDVTIFTKSVDVMVWDFTCFEVTSSL